MANFIQWATESALFPQPELALGTAVALAGALYGRRYRTPTNARTQFYVAGVASTGSGKDRARTCALRLLTAAGAVHLIGPTDFSSGSAVFEALDRNPCILSLIDEFGDVLQAAASPRAPVHLTQLLKTLKLVESSAGEMLPGTGFATKERNREPLLDPHLVIYSTTTVKSLVAGMESRLVLDGFVNRWLLVRGRFDVRRQGRRRAGSPEPPTGLVDVVREHLEAGKPAGDLARASGASQPRTAGEAAGIQERLDDLDDGVKDAARGREEYLGTWTRLAFQSEKLALVRAVSRDPVSPVVGHEDLDWGVEFARWAVGTAWFYVCGHVADNPHEARCKALLRILREAGAQGLSRSDLGRARPSGGWDPRDRARALESLVEASLVDRRSVPTGKRPRTVYTARMAGSGR